MSTVTTTMTKDNIIDYIESSISAYWVTDCTVNNGTVTIFDYYEEEEITFTYQQFQDAATRWAQETLKSDTVRQSNKAGAALMLADQWEDAQLYFDGIVADTIIQYACFGKRVYA